MLVNVKIESDVLLEMLVNRLDFWSSALDDSDKELFRTMYKNYIDGGLFEDCKLDVMKTVDNDVVNWCSVLHKDKLNKDDWESLKYGNIEVLGDDRILIRH